MSKNGVGNRRFVTVTEIATELRVRATTLRESGILDGCRHLPAGTLGRHELWLWDDVQQAVLEFAQGASGTRSQKPQRRRPATSFASVTAK